MEAQAQTILKMSETLENSGFEQDQAVAVIESIAMAMQTFAVTPEMLDDRLARQMLETKKLISDERLQTNQQFEAVNDRLDEIPKLRDAINQLQSSMLRYFLAFTLIILGGLMGTLGAVLAS